MTENSTPPSDARILALLHRRLFQACGGVHEAAQACGVSDKLLYRCQDPNAEDTLALGRVLALERYCGQPVLSLGMAEAVSPIAEQIQLTEASLAAAVATGDLLKEVQVATADGVVTNFERERVRRAAHGARDAIRRVEAAADKESA